MVDLIRKIYRLNRSVRRKISTAIGITKLRLFGRAQIGNRVCIAGRIRVLVSPGGKLTIGNNVKLYSGFVDNPVGNSSINALCVGPEGNLNIKDGTGISATTIVCRKAITISENTFIGGGTNIYDNDFHSINPDIRIRGNDDEVKSEPITIGKECFIGGHCIILKGVNIGDRSIIGAGSVVTKDVPQSQIWAGNPARFIKSIEI